MAFTTLTGNPISRSYDRLVQYSGSAIGTATGTLLYDFATYTASFANTSSYTYTSSYSATSDTSSYLTRNRIYEVTTSMALSGSAGFTVADSLYAGKIGINNTNPTSNIHILPSASNSSVKLATDGVYNGQLDIESTVPGYNLLSVTQTNNEPDINFQNIYGNSRMAIKNGQISYNCNLPTSYSVCYASSNNEPGTVSTTSGSPYVYGVGTRFRTTFFGVNGNNSLYLSPGYIYVNGEYRYISGVKNDTVLTCSTNFANTNAPGTEYSFAPYINIRNAIPRFVYTCNGHYIIYDAIGTPVFTYDTNNIGYPLMNLIGTSGGGINLWSNAAITSINQGLNLRGSHVHGKYVKLYASSSTIPDLTVNNGRVGILTQVPTASLEVVGNISASAITCSIYAGANYIQLPYSSSINTLTPTVQTGSMYFFNDLIYVYTGTAWKSASLA